MYVSKKWQKMANKTKINIVFIAVFVAAITLPYVFAHRDTSTRVSDEENRELAVYPVLYDRENGWNTSYIDDFDDWINDNLRGRTELVKINSTLQYELFHRIVRNNLTAGKNNWLFGKNDELLAEYQHTNLLSDDQLGEFSGNMQEFSDYLERHGISFYYMQCYDKESIYPDEYISGVKQTGSISRADQVVTELEDNTNINVIDIKDDLKEHAKTEQVYFKYADTHWNDCGAFVGYQDLMYRIQNDYPQIKVLEKSDYDISEMEQSITLYGYQYPYVDTTPKYTVKNPGAIEITDEIKKDWPDVHVQDFIHEFVNDSCGNSLKILVVGDSYIRQFLKDDIAESFSDTLNIDWSNLDNLDSVIARFQPDIVVLENTEYSADNIIDYVNQMQFAGE